MYGDTWKDHQKEEQFMDKFRRWPWWAPCNRCVKLPFLEIPTACIRCWVINVKDKR